MTVLIDEPENNLHPEWQLLFAELLVLLQKESNLRILLNTHSPYFFNAIEVYSDKHGIKNKGRILFIGFKNGGSRKDIVNSIAPCMLLECTSHEAAANQ